MGERELHYRKLFQQPSLSNLIAMELTLHTAQTTSRTDFMSAKKIHAGDANNKAAFIYLSLSWSGRLGARREYIHDEHQVHTQTVYLYPLSLIVIHDINGQTDRQTDTHIDKQAEIIYTAMEKSKDHF